MNFFVMILAVLILGDLAWWWRSDRLVRDLGAARAWRFALGVFFVLQIAGLLLFVLSRFLSSHFAALPTAVMALIYVWHCLLLLPLLAGWLLVSLAQAMVKAGRWLGSSAWRDALLRVPISSLEVGRAGARPSEVTRRQFLQTAVAAAPAVFAIGATSISLAQIEQFRVRRLVVPLRVLPPELDGLTIAHVSDLHVGQFTRGALLNRIVETTNALGADLVVLTGDLINFALSDLATGLDVVVRMQAKHGVFMCEGNHDLFESPEEFRARSRAADVRLLVNETAVVSIHGREVELLGLRWGAGSGDPHANENRGDEAIARSLRQLAAQRRLDAFPILLAHHPHAYDFAGELPLTLAGHTHGGQLMLNRDQGFGPMLFRYWSGPYGDTQRALVVSNGVGNWFPLRTRAPAEIIHLTLKRALS